MLTGSNSALRMLLWNAAGAAAILAWNVVCGVAIFGILKAIKLFRVAEADEVTGLDIVKHNEPAYPKGESRVSGVARLSFNSPVRRQH